MPQKVQNKKVPFHLIHVPKIFGVYHWRLGYAAGPEKILTQMLKIHQFAIMCAPTTSQYAAIEAMRNGDEDVERMRDAYDKRRRFLVHELNEMGLSCFEPFGWVIWKWHN